MQGGMGTILHGWCWPAPSLCPSPRCGAGCRCGREVLECAGREQLEGAWLRSGDSHRRGLGRAQLALLEPRQGAVMFWTGRDWEKKRSLWIANTVSGEQLASSEVQEVGQGHPGKGRERSV